MRKILTGMLIAILVITIVATTLVYAGVYNVAATQPHLEVTRDILEATVENSVRAHAEGIAIPELSSTSMIRDGARHFQEYCVLCHGAPGVKASEIGQGLRPNPPELSRVARQWEPNELFWIVKHGIKMTGMPAFGPTHGDDTLWSIVAFVNQLPEMTPEEYEKLRKQLGPGDHHAPFHWRPTLN